MSTVKLETFKDIFDLTCSRIDEEEPEVAVETMIKDAINYAYEQVVKRCKRFTTTIVPIVNGIGMLPDDLITIENITPKLKEGEYRKGNALFSETGTSFNITYSYAPEHLINDDDVPDIPKRFFYVLSSYACYVYFMYRKKPQVATMHLQEFKVAVGDLDQDYTEQPILDVYGGDLNG